MPKKREPKSFVDKDDGSEYHYTGPGDDPWKDFADGKDTDGEFTLECTKIKPAGDDMCRVDIQVSGPDTPWKAKFLMYPNFPDDEKILVAKARDGLAQEYFWAVGPFVIGAVVVVPRRKKDIRLELDLVGKVKGNKSVDGADASWWDR